MLDLIATPSPNFEGRPHGAAVKYVVLHYTGMQSGAAALQRLCEPASKVSAHYVVEEDGRMFKLVEETKRAWHAGKGFWRGSRDVNSVSIGIEIVNPGHEFGYRAFPKAQMEAVKALCADIKERHKLPPSAFIGHSDIAPARKEDPGELFDWAMLATAGIGLLPAPIAGGMMNEAEARAALNKIGYDPEAEFGLVLKAFQRHFAPKHMTGAMNSETAAMLRAVSAS